MGIRTVPAGGAPRAVPQKVASAGRYFQQMPREREPEPEETREMLLRQAIERKSQHFVVDTTTGQKLDEMTRGANVRVPASQEGRVARGEVPVDDWTSREWVGEDLKRSAREAGVTVGASKHPQLTTTVSTDERRTKGESLDLDIMSRRAQGQGSGAPARDGQASQATPAGQAHSAPSEVA